jgi:hypothetical protein
MHALVERLLNRLRLSRAFHRECYADIIAVRDAAKGGKISKETLIDCRHLAYMISKDLDDARKEVDVLERLCSDIACALYMTEHMAEVTSERIIGEIATGTPDLKMQANLPPKGSEAYLKLLEHFGVNKAHAAADLVHVHWPGLRDYLTALTAAGKPPPPGIKAADMKSKYVVSTRQKSGINIEDLLGEQSDGEERTTPSKSDTPF